MSDRRSEPVSPFDSPDFDPQGFLAGLVFDPPGARLDMPVPPVLGEDEVVPVRRTVELDPSVDATLRATAFSRGISVEQLLEEIARHAA